MGTFSWEEARAAGLVGRQQGAGRRGGLTEEERFQVALVEALPLALKPAVICFHVPNERPSKVRRMIWDNSIS